MRSNHLQRHYYRGGSKESSLFCLIYDDDAFWSARTFVDAHVSCCVPGCCSFCKVLSKLWAARGLDGPRRATRTPCVLQRVRPTACVRRTGRGETTLTTSRANKSSAGQAAREKWRFVGWRASTLVRSRRLYEDRERKRKEKKKRKGFKMLNLEGKTKMDTEKWSKEIILE